RPSHGEADESGDLGRDGQPLAYFLVVLATTQDNAADLVPALAVGGRDYAGAVFAAVQTLDFPNVRLHARVLQFPDGPDHQPGPQLQVIGLLVAFHAVQLRLLRRHQKLEHEQAIAAVQIVRKPFQSLGLPFIEVFFALGVVAHQHFAEGWTKHFNVL